MMATGEGSTGLTSRLWSTPLLALALAGAPIMDTALAEEEVTSTDSVAVETTDMATDSGTAAAAEVDTTSTTTEMSGSETMSDGAMQSTEPAAMESGMMSEGTAQTESSAAMESPDGSAAAEPAAIEPAAVEPASVESSAVETAAAPANAVPAEAATQTKADVTELEKVQVTGSHIKRIDVEGPSPVLVIKREDIERSGVSTLSDVLRNLPINGNGSYDETFTNSFSKGSAGISLRGLGSSATLLLINGRRVPNYPFAQNITETFADLNSIPLGAVERIDILKDGASAIYGSDAIAGVVNVILRKDYNESEATVGYGQTSKGDAEETQLSFISGSSSEKGNVTFNFGYYHREPYGLKDREISRSSDQTGHGGYDFRSSAPPVSNVFSEDLSTVLSNGGSLRRFDYSPYITALPETDRMGLNVLFNRKLTANLDLFGRVAFNHNNSYQEAAPTPLFGDIDDVLVAADHPNNTYGQPVYVRWRMVDMGPRTDNITSDTQSITTGLQGAMGDIDWEGAVFYHQQRSDEVSENYVNRLALTNAINNGSINPFGTTVNSQEALDGVRATTTRNGESRTWGADISFNGELGNLGPVPVTFAAGVETRKEALVDTPDALSAGNQIIGSGGTSSEGDRELHSAYTEFGFDIAEVVEVQLALRSENYSDFGSSTNPKLAVKYRPLDMLLFRASWGTGFRAPSLPQLYLGESISHDFLEDTSRCAITDEDEDCGGSQYVVAFSGNPDLDPEESESVFFGVVVEPLDRFTIGVDYWKYEHDDIIDSDPQFILDNESRFPGRVVRGAPDANNPNIPGRIQRINDSFINIGRQETYGYDLDISWAAELGAGDFGVDFTYTRVESFKRSSFPGEPLEEYAGKFNNDDHYPEGRANFGIGYSIGNHSISSAVQYISSYEDKFTDPDDKIVRIDHYFSGDLQYVFSGLKNSSFTFGIENVTDAEPPFSNGEHEGYQFSTYSSRGRFYYTRYTAQF